MPRFLYTALLFIALPFVPIRLLWRGIKQPEYLKHWNERFGFYTTPANKNAENKIIWLHCVSVGETRAAVPLIEALKMRYPNHQILLTHTTPTGRQTSEQLFGENVQRVYLPYDVPFAVNHFLKHFKPSIGLLMETELWFNLIAVCKRAHVPLLLVNARLSEKSASGYAKLGSLVQAGLLNLSAIAAQTEMDAVRLQALGARNVAVTGNLKFDVKPPVDTLAKGMKLRQLFAEKRTVFLAASTREGEEALILDAIKDLDIVTVIVPRHPQRFDEVAAIIEKRNLKYMRRTNIEKPIGSDTKVVLGNTMGELFTYYAACDFTFIGGSLLNYGGQNLIEACSVGKPVLIGPHTFNFAEATKGALKTGAAILVRSPLELREKIEYLHKNKAEQEKISLAASAFSQRSAGATARIMQAIEKLPI